MSRRGVSSRAARRRGAGPARRASSASSSSRTSAARSPWSSSATSRRRIRSGVGSRKRSTRSARSLGGLAEQRGGAHPGGPGSRRRRRARCRARGGAARRGTARSGRATAPTGRARRRAAGRRRRARARPQLARRRWRGRGRGASARPGGAVAAIGRTGRIPYGRQSSRSKRTGPAATGAAVARRRAVTASASSPGASGASSRARLERPLELEHAQPVGLAAEVAREQSRRLGPHRRELAGRGGADADPVAELDARAAGDADERRDGAVRVAFAEERLLELRVGAVEGRVVPVEAAAALGGADEQRHEHAAVERAALVGRHALVGAREDARGRLALEVGDGGAHVVALRTAGRRGPRRSRARAAGTRTASAVRTSRAPRTRRAGRRRTRDPA